MVDGGKWKNPDTGHIEWGGPKRRSDATDPNTPQNQQYASNDNGTLSDVPRGAFPASGAGALSSIGKFRPPPTGAMDPKFYDAIIKSEGTDLKGNPYDASFKNLASPKPLSEMNMDEALAFGDKIRANSGSFNSSAKGAFQIVNTTQKDAMKALGYGGEEPFDAGHQQAIADWIKKTQGTDAWTSFQKHPDLLRQAQDASAKTSSMSRLQKPTDTSQPKDLTDTAPPSVLDSTLKTPTESLKSIGKPISSLDSEMQDSLKKMSDNLSQGASGVGSGATAMTASLSKGAGGVEGGVSQLVSALSGGKGGGSGGGMGSLGGGGGLSSLFNGGGSSGIGDVSAATSDFSMGDVASSFDFGSVFAGIFHSGGVVGNSPMDGSRNLSMGVFNNAPRFHEGMPAASPFKDDEFPAVLQRGERVLTSSQDQRNHAVIKGLSQELAANRGSGQSQPKPAQNNQYHVHQTINTPNADSFRKSQGQLAGEASVHIQRMGLRHG